MSDRYARLRRIQTLDPAHQNEQIRALSADDFAWDIEQSLRLALFRTYAVPTISALLDATGEFGTRGDKRYDDTTLLLYEIFLDGPDSVRGRAAVKRLNRIHGAYDISDEDYVYTLATFVVIPTRWLARYGWRPLSAHEIDANLQMYQRLGAMMGLRDIPATHAAFEQFLDDYERRHFRYTPSNQRVAEATIRVLIGRVPAPLRPLVRPTVRALIDAPLRTALGLAAPPPGLRTMIDGALKLRARALRWLPPAPDGRARRAPPNVTYPNGYGLQDLGPEHSRRCPHAG